LYFYSLAYIFILNKLCSLGLHFAYIEDLYWLSLLTVMCFCDALNVWLLKLWINNLFSYIHIYDNILKFSVWDRTFDNTSYKLNIYDSRKKPSCSRSCPHFCQIHSLLIMGATKFVLSRTIHKLPAIDLSLSVQIKETLRQLVLPSNFGNSKDILMLLARR